MTYGTFNLKVLRAKLTLLTVSFAWQCQVSLYLHKIKKNFSVSAPPAMSLFTSWHQSNYPTVVLRDILRQYHALSFLTSTPLFPDRRTPMPFHFSAAERIVRVAESAPSLFIS
jgi:hypothetical protein